MVKSKNSATAAGSAGTSYWGSHRPGSPIDYPDYTPTIDQLASGRFHPADYLEHPEWYLVMEGGPEERGILRILRSVQGNPDAEVVVYRGGPSDMVNTGDWVSLSRGYAEDYAEGGRVVSIVAKASEISFDGDDIREFGYWGAPKRGR